VLTDGVIMSAVTLGRTDVRSKHPVVLVGDREPGSAIDHVGIKNREAAQAAVTHLLESGRRRILLLGAEHGPRRSYQLRRQGYQAALKKYGIADGLYVECDWTTAAAEEALMETELEFDGIFAMNDSAALGALRALRRRGLDVPGDVSVVGFDDIVESGHSTPTLSTVAPLLADIASNALDLLEEQLDPDHVPQHRMAGYALRIRESSTP
jgi:DNA-binding LacI/PurR family transcriptional regulator